MRFAVAIDGPAGSGKSTVAKLLAKELNIIYIDTGAMYRSVAFYCIKNNILTTDERAVCSILDKIDIEIKTIENEQRFFLNSEDVSGLIRTQQVGQGASNVAVFFSVRSKLVMLQRQMAKKSSVVMDGRDIGSNVLVDAEVKIYLDASVFERAKRRLADYKNQNEDYSLETVIEQIKQRDYNDMNREHNPLIIAKDAIVIDSTSMTIDKVLEEVVRIIKEKTKMEM